MLLFNQIFAIIWPKLFFSFEYLFTKSFMSLFSLTYYLGSLIFLLFISIFYIVYYGVF